APTDISTLSLHDALPIYYVSQLSERDIKEHQLNLNFDMVGSPNFVRFVYDGDGDAFGTEGPDGSDKIEALFNDYFASQDLATDRSEEHTSELQSRENLVC